MNILSSALLVTGLILSNAVHAHVGVDTHGSFAHGLLHPFSGLDHMLAMIAVGLWASQIGGRMLAALPGIFIAAMMIGGVVGLSGIALPLAELTIGGSVLMLGALVAFAVKSPGQWASPLIALFALVHGYAHGAGMPDFSAATPFLTGVLMATASLHALGVAAGVALKEQARVLQAGGVAISVAGLCLMVAA